MSKSPAIGFPRSYVEQLIAELKNSLFSFRVRVDEPSELESFLKLFRTTDEQHVARHSYSYQLVCYNPVTEKDDVVWLIKPDMVDQMLAKVFEDQAIVQLERFDAAKPDEYVRMISYNSVWHRQQGLVVYRRAGKSAEKLMDKWSIGVGGHIEADEIKDLIDFVNVVHETARREVAEEIGLSTDGNSNNIPWMVYDPSNLIGQHYVGFLDTFVFEEEIKSQESELADLTLIPIDFSTPFAMLNRMLGKESPYVNLEPWSVALMFINDMHLGRI